MMDLMEEMALVQTRGQQASCPLLERLSLDEILYIADNLPPASLMVLCQTCKALRVVFWSRFYPDDIRQPGDMDEARRFNNFLTHRRHYKPHVRNVVVTQEKARVTTLTSVLHFFRWIDVWRPGHVIGAPAPCRSRKQRLNFLACLARDRPDDWVCEICIKLHRIDAADTPRTRMRSLPWCHPPSSSSVAPSIWVQYPYPAYTLYHRHIQMALKYTRLGAVGHEDADGPRRRYLERLLAPCQEYKFDDVSKLAIRYTVYPRIVGDRFVLAGEWHCYQTAQDSPGEIQFAVPCLHQHYRPRDWSHVGPATGSRGDLRRAIIELSTSLNRTEVRGACARCPTDFSIQGSPGHTTIRHWQDFGPEGSPSASIWTSRLRNGPIYAHEPGSIRRLYESAAESESWEASGLVPSISR